MKPKTLLALLPLVLVLSACSLAADITPPPDYTPPAVSQPQPVSSGPLFPASAPDPVAGAAIFVENCAPCHGPSGKGDGPDASKLPGPVAAIGTADVARKSTPAQWYQVVTNGNMANFMPPFQSLTDSQRWDVLAYVYSLSSTANDSTAALFEQNCAHCHGDKGQGNGPDAASQAKTPANFTDQSFMAQKSGEDLFQSISNGVAPAMPAFASKLSDVDRRALADFVRKLSFTSTAQVAAASTPATNATPQASATQAASATGAVTSTLASTSTQTMIGTVTGLLKNGSGGPLPADLDISLHGFDNTQMVVTGTTKLQPDGSFSFSNITMKPGLAIMATTRYADTTYGSDVSTVITGTNKVNLTLTVYDSTTDMSQLSVDRLHLFFDFTNPNSVQVIELYIMSNTGNKTIIAKSSGAGIVSFGLPSSATNLQFQDGAIGSRYLQTGDGFADTMPVQPGQAGYQVTFAFDMPYNGKQLDLVQSLKLPVNAIVLLLPDAGVKVTGDGMQDGGTRDFQGVTYHMYNGSQHTAGSQLSLSLSGSPGQAASVSASNGTRNNTAIGLGALGVVLIGVSIWLYRRQATAREAEEREEDLGKSEQPEEDPDQIIDAIIALDDQYKAGSLPEEAYRQRRTELKERLRMSKSD